MSTTSLVVLTAIGTDRPGLVSELSDKIAACGGNWLDARMASLAGQFAGILLVEVAADHVDTLVERLQELRAQGLRLTIEKSEGGEGPVPAAGSRCRLELLGHDRVGLVRDISRVLAGLQVSIVDFETERRSGSFSGEAMFKAQALIQVPAQLEFDQLRQALEALANELMVDLGPAP